MWPPRDLWLEVVANLSTIDHVALVGLVCRLLPCFRSAPPSGPPAPQGFCKVVHLTWGHRLHYLSFSCCWRFQWWVGVGLGFASCTHSLGCRWQSVLRSFSWLGVLAAWSSVWWRRRLHQVVGFQHSVVYQRRLGVSGCHALSSRLQRLCKGDCACGASMIRFAFVAGHSSAGARPWSPCQGKACWP